MTNIIYGNTCEQLELPNIIDYRQEKYKIEVRQDTWCDSPRTWSNLGVIFVPNGCRYCKNESDLDWDSVCEGNRKRDRKALEKLGYIAFPLTVYDHSGVSIYLGSPCDAWDSGQIGWYLVSKETVRKDYGCKRISPKLMANIEKIVEGEIETYSDWANGNCWEYTFFHNDEEEEGCSICGFIEDYEEMAKDFYDYLPKYFRDAFTRDEVTQFLGEPEY